MNKKIITGISLDERCLCGHGPYPFLISDAYSDEFMYMCAQEIMVVRHDQLLNLGLYGVETKQLKRAVNRNLEGILKTV
jgi:hypothetical protein